MILNRIAIAAIRAYQIIWHPIYEGMNDRRGGFKVCNFEPSCSNYAIQAMQKYSFVIAVNKINTRLNKCDGIQSGYDPP